MTTLTVRNACDLINSILLLEKTSSDATDGAPRLELELLASYRLGKALKNLRDVVQASRDLSMKVMADKSMTDDEREAWFQKEILTETVEVDLPRIPLSMVKSLPRGNGVTDAFGCVATHLISEDAAPVANN